jgi:hypothetical protein
MMVDAVEAPVGSEPAEIAAAATPMAEPATVPASPPVSSGAAAPTAAVSAEQVQQIVDSIRDVFNRAAQPPRWPMYVRQWKQFIRGVDSTFDERKWGFTTIMEFLRVCQREGLFRLERDRRGQIRVFPGNALQTAPVGAPVQVQQEAQPEEIQEAAPVDTFEAPIPEAIDVDQEIAADARVPELIDIDEPPVKPRRTRKPPSAGNPAARKSTGARATTRRRKAPAA